MNYEKGIKEIRKEFVETHLPEDYAEMKENGRLSDYLTRIEEEYYQIEEKAYDELFLEYMKNRKQPFLFENAERLAKEVELKILARERADKEVLFRDSL